MECNETQDPNATSREKNRRMRGFFPQTTGLKTTGFMRFWKEVPDIPNNPPLCTSSERVHIRDETVHNEVLQCQDSALAQRLVTNITVAAVAASNTSQSSHCAPECASAPQDKYPAACRAGLHTTTPTPCASNQSPTSEQCPHHSHSPVSQIDVSLVRRATRTLPSKYPWPMRKTTFGNFPCLT